VRLTAQGGLQGLNKPEGDVAAVIQIVWDEPEDVPYPRCSAKS
jgi:hypothetical protein